MSRRIDPEGNERLYLQKLVDLRAMRVLEIGCGDARLTASYAPMTRWVLGIDVKAEGLAPTLHGQPGSKATFAVANAELLPCADQSVDVVLFARSL